MLLVVLGARDSHCSRACFFPFRWTDEDGCCQLLLAPGRAKAGTYKLCFERATYWQSLVHTSFYSLVEVQSGESRRQVPQELWPKPQGPGAVARLMGVIPYAPSIPGEHPVEGDPSPCLLTLSPRLSSPS